MFNLPINKYKLNIVLLNLCHFKTRCQISMQLNIHPKKKKIKNNIMAGQDAIKTEVLNNKYRLPFYLDFLSL